MRNVWVALLVLVVLIALIVVAINIFFGKEVSFYGYVVGEDRKIYMVNLDSGELEWVSRELEGIGRPTNIEINDEHSILYIGSDRDRWQFKYVPLVAVRLNKSAEWVFRSYVDPSPVEVTAIGFSRIAPVYYIRLSHDGEFLYLAYVNPDFRMTTMVNSLTGRYIGKLEAPIQKQAEISPDGTLVADIWPSGTRVIETELEEYPAEIWVRDLRTGANVSRVELVDNQGLHPPWGSKDDHFIYVNYRYDENVFRLEVYNRNSGELVAVNDDFWATMNFAQQHVTHIPGTDNVAMTVGSEILIFNGLTAEVIKRIHVVDNIRLTEVVVSDKSPIVNGC